MAAGAAGTAASIDFTDPAIQANPIPVYERLRAEAPIFWNGPAQGWLISRYDDIVGLFNDPRMSSQRVDATFRPLPADVRAELTPLRTVLLSRMLLSDPPRHTRLRTLVTKPFSAKASQGRRDRIQEFCDGFIDRVIASGEMDVMRDFAAPLPSRTIADTLGIPNDMQAQFTAWAHDQVRVYDRPGTAHDRVAVMRQGQRAMLEMKAYMEGIIADRRREPQDDLLTMLVEAEAEGDRLSDDELIAMVVALLVGGNNSTAHAIGNAALTFIRQPEARERLLREPDLIRPAIEEVLRFESPVQATSRVAKEAIEIGGETIQLGDNVSLLLGSANRDAAQFPDANRFVIDRKPNRHLTFAHGPHFCLGSALARNVTQIATLTLLQRCRDLELATDTLEWNEGFSFRSLKTLPVRFRPA
jgi:pimeloyl-[acyl-carrier protein] synthase